MSTDPRRRGPAHRRELRSQHDALPVAPSCPDQGLTTAGLTACAGSSLWHEDGDLSPIERRMLEVLSTCSDAGAVDIARALDVSVMTIAYRLPQVLKRLHSRSGCLLKS
jgi:hypothetical protein